ncbi:hypothetical protein AG0111_0g11664 [Alternaria gaisen]|uniref:Uncharacterized protein n=1 Tax=Alternaria gaisen TaxID=167740 RepID=A0ACB6F6A0_9PLEO|nr:hypothetical protein AG0111_0g11664 [Alternaria gaisen]
MPVPRAPSLQAPTPSWDKVVWVSFPDRRPLDQTATLAIQYFPDDHESLGHDAWLAEARVLDLRNTVIDAEDGGCYVHQGLVTMLAVKSRNQIAVDAYTWDWLTRRLRESFLSSSCRGENGEALRTVLFLHWTTDEPTNPTLDSVYSAVRLLKHIHGTAFRAYPNESEAWQERAKLGDIRALDDIARSSPPEFSYRPKTCFGHGPCALQEDSITVHKRTHSACATHVHIRKQRDRQQLTCKVEMPASKLPSKQRSGRKSMLAKTNKSSEDPTHDATSSGQTHWFHQEFVPALRDYEFRVFVVTKRNEQGIRGRSGRVVAFAKTAFNQETQTLASRELLPEDLEPSLTRSHLEQFCIWVFESLRARTDSMTFFESLEVGTRLDIGVAEDGMGGKRLFVNEITRWYGAHYFSHNICSEPKTQICKAFAHAFGELLQSGMGDVF